MNSIKYIYKTGFGPSSSHTMGPGRAAEIFKKMHPKASHFKAYLYGSLGATGKGHLTDIAIIDTFKPISVEIIWKAEVELPLHPNGLEFEAFDVNGNLIEKWRVYSIGGGNLFDENKYIPEPKQVYPLSKMDDILAWCDKEGKTFWEYVKEFDEPDTFEYLKEVWTVMKNAIQAGRANEGVLPGGLGLSRRAPSYHTKAKMYDGVMKRISLAFAYSLAIAEENSSGGKIVTAPTCGSAGVVPATLYTLYKLYDFPEKKIINALATAGLIGNLVKTNASISGAEVGCQGEIGTACAMASAAATQIMGGTPGQIEYAAEMGMEHHLGLTCDPVMGLVQIPCIERNAMATSRALDSAVYAILSDGKHRISFDEVVETMKKTGEDMKNKYRETGLGGLAEQWNEK